MHRFININELWIYYYDSELKPDSSATKRVCVQKSVKRGFWDDKKVFVDYPQIGKTVNFNFDCNLLNQLDANICEERPALKKIIFQDNGHAQKAIAKINKLKYKLNIQTSNLVTSFSPL